MSQYSSSLDDGRVTFEDPRLAETKAKDVVCGNLVDPRRSVLVEHHGLAFYFCGPDCKEQFKADPERYGAT